MPIWETDGRHFAIRAGWRVLEVAADAGRFAYATDVAIWTYSERWAENRPVVIGGADGQLGLADRTFDFIYCEHLPLLVSDPAPLCGELMRLGRRGAIVCSRPWYVQAFAGAGTRWLADFECGTLIFRERGRDEAATLAEFRRRLGSALGISGRRAIPTPQPPESAFCLTWQTDFAFRVLRLAERRRLQGLEHLIGCRPRRNAAMTARPLGASSDFLQG